jgi:hypothetical protein
MRSRSRFRCLRDNPSIRIESETLDIGGSYIKPENQILWHKCYRRKKKGKWLGSADRFIFSVRIKYAGISGLTIGEIGRHSDSAGRHNHLDVSLCKSFAEIRREQRIGHQDIYRAQRSDLSEGVVAKLRPIHDNDRAAR